MNFVLGKQEDLERSNNCVLEPRKCFVYQRIPHGLVLFVAPTVVILVHAEVWRIFTD